MKAAFLCCVLLLAGSASCGPVEANSLTLPEGIPDWIQDLLDQLPGSIDAIIEQLPQIIEALPDLIDKIPEIVENIIETLPELIPVILDKLPEIIAQIPDILEQIPDVLETIINQIPDVIPIILDRIPVVIAAVPDVYEKIREVFNNLDLPWTLPEVATPEWWPEEPITLPEYNAPVPGTLTSIEENPGIVQIEIGIGPVWIQACTGSIITSWHVLSSARCFSGGWYNPRIRRVRAGVSARNEAGVVVDVQYAVNHPSYGEYGFNGDISVVRLGINLVLGATIQQTPIVSAGFALPAGVGVELVGWGSTAQGDPYANKELYKVGLIVIDEDLCKSKWSRIPVIPVSENNLCVGRPETGGRNGDLRDIGAPIYYSGILVGLTSFSVPYIGNQDFPVVATNISPYTNWVIENAV